MGKIQKKKWYRTNGFWGTVAAFLTVIVAAIAIIVTRSSDFSVTVNPIEGIVIKGEEISADIVIVGEKYNEQIKLMTPSQTDNIDISFSPSVGTLSPKFTSKVKVKFDNSISEGTYEIEITAVGAKNKTEKNVVFYVTVVKPPFQQTPLGGFFFPDGWMGDVDDISYDANSFDDSAIDNNCIKIQYNAKGSNKNNWAGIYWVYPNENWGDFPKGRDLSGATLITFYAKGEKGGERAEFKVGGISGKYRDSCFPPIEKAVTLSKNWKKYEINISNRDLSNVFGGFCWVTNTTQNPKGCTIYLDQIQYE